MLHCLLLDVNASEMLIVDRLLPVKQLQKGCAAGGNYLKQVLLRSEEDAAGSVRAIRYPQICTDDQNKRGATCPQEVLTVCEVSVWGEDLKGSLDM